MKLILREYLAALRERDELDAILPDLISELGFVVFSRPGRGTTQHGVDIAAVREANGEKKVYLFTVKKGDLTRATWDGDTQALRPSLAEIEDVYIPTKIPPEYKDLKIVIVICFGGEVKETVRAALTGYTTKHSSPTLSFEEWNGDALSEHLLAGVLKEEVLPKQWRSHFQKAVALLDEPDTAYRHFAALLRVIAASATSSAERVRAARQIYLCVWIMYVWARDVGNFEAPYRASELALLHLWELFKPEIGAAAPSGEAIGTVFTQLINVHLSVTAELLDKKVLPHAGTVHALTFAVETHGAADINLKLFDLLGRVAMAGLWLKWSGQFGDEAFAAQREEMARSYFDKGAAMILANPHLLLPISDSQATDVALFLVLWIMSGGDRAPMARWLTDMTVRLKFTMQTRGTYPIVSNDYRDLLFHPKERTEEYFKENTKASTLIPLLTAWLTGMGETQATDALAQLAAGKLSHCTMQFWLPDDDSEEHLYLNTANHGRALTDLDVTDGASLLKIMDRATREKDAFNTLSAVASGNWPIVLLACRHWRWPVPPQFYLGRLYVDEAEDVTPEAPAVPETEV